MNKKKDNTVFYYLIIVSLLVLGSIIFNPKTSEDKNIIENDVFCSYLGKGLCKDNSGVYQDYCEGDNLAVQYYCIDTVCFPEYVTCSVNGVCQNGECIEKENSINEIIIEYPTTIEQHLVCDNTNGQCVFVEGSGEDECQVDDDCGCVCDTGLCCDGCYYRTTDYICDSRFAKDFGCPQGTGCGGVVGLRYKVRYCPGNATLCNGEISEWGDWNIYDFCNIKQLCIDGVAECKYSPKCR